MKARIGVAKAAPAGDQSGRIADLPNYSGYSSTLKTYLSDENYTTLQDVRNTFGLAWRLGETSADYSDVREIDAHANLEIGLTVDASARQGLINNDYLSLSAIAETNLDEFLEDTQAVFTGSVAAAQIYYGAQAVDGMITGIDVGGTAGIGNGMVQVDDLPGQLVSSLEDPALGFKLYGTLSNSRCACPPCYTTVSPLAYLHSLIEYLTNTPEGKKRNLRKLTQDGNAGVSLDELSKHFHQDFLTLYRGCRPSDERVCQIRIANEILHSKIDITDVAAISDANYDELRYQVYSAILAGYGVTLKELQDAFPTSPYDSNDTYIENTDLKPARDRIRRKMNLDRENVNQVDLYRILLTTESGTDERNLNEYWMQTKFGLKDTQSKPENQHTIIDYTNSGLVLAFECVEPIWHHHVDTVNERRYGRVYILFAQETADGPISVSVHKHPDRTLQDLIASGTLVDHPMDATLKVADLLPELDTGFSASITVDGEALSGLLPDPDDPNPDPDYPVEINSTEVHILPLLLGMQYKSLDLEWERARQREPNPFLDRTVDYIIDPDLIGPEEFRRTHLPDGDANANTAFVIWKNRVAFLQTEWEALMDDTNPALFDKAGELTSVTSSYTAENGPPPITHTPWDITISPLSDYGGNINEILDKLNQDLKVPENDGTTIYSDAKSAIEEGLHWTVPQFLRFYELANTPQTAERTREGVNLLIVAIKKAFAEDWGTEEQSFVTLDLDTFCRPVNYPVEGNWLKTFPEEVTSYYNIDSEDYFLLDDTYVKEIDLASAFQPQISGTIVQDYKEQKGAIADKYQSILAGIENDILNGKSGEDIFINALATIELYYNSTTEDVEFPQFTGSSGNPSTGLEEQFNALHSDLQSGDSNAIEHAETHIKEELFLTIEEFDFIYNEIYVKVMPSLGLELEVTASVWEQLASILTKVFRYGVHYPGLSTTYNANTLHGLEFWKYFAHRLESWRTTRERRDQWEQAIAILENSRPIIDPDLWGPGDFIDPETSVPGLTNNPAYNFYTARLDILEGSDWLNAPGFAPSDIAADVEKLIGFSVIDDPADLASLQALIQAMDAGVAWANNRLAQLNLKAGEARRLWDLYDTAASAYANDDWVEIRNILVAMIKRRKASEWWEEETDSNTPVITMSPRFFRLVYNRASDRSAYGQLVNVPYRSDLDRRERLLDILEARLDNMQSLKDELADVVEEAETPFLIALRDLRLKVLKEHYNSTNGEDEDLNQHDYTRMLSQQLMIDLENNCCQPTTRVAQGIETLQNFMLSLRMGQYNYPLESGEELALWAQNFDEDWQWLGSYSRWRSLMFVYLYPENLLKPQYVPNMTPKFREIIKNVRRDRRFGPDDICYYMADYEEYIRDIQSLELKASVMTEERGTGQLCNDSQLITPFHYLFAITTRRGVNGQRKVYHTRKEEPYNTPELADTQPWDDTLEAWQEMPFTDPQFIIGARVYQNPKAERYIYLFVVDKIENQNEIAYLCYDLAKGDWDTEATLLTRNEEQDYIYYHEDNMLQIAQPENETDPIVFAVYVPDWGVPFGFLANEAIWAETEYAPDYGNSSYELSEHIQQAAIEEFGRKSGSARSSGTICLRMMNEEGDGWLLSYWTKLTIAFFSEFGNFVLKTSNDNIGDLDLWINIFFTCRTGGYKGGDWKLKHIEIKDFDVHRYLKSEDNDRKSLDAYFIRHSLPTKSYKLSNAVPEPFEADIDWQLDVEENPDVSGEWRVIIKFSGSIYSVINGNLFPFLNPYEGIVYLDKYRTSFVRNVESLTQSTSYDSQCYIHSLFQYKKDGHKLLCINIFQGNPNIDFQNTFYGLRWNPSHSSDPRGSKFIIVNHIFEGGDPQCKFIGPYKAYYSDESKADLNDFHFCFQRVNDVLNETIAKGAQIPITSSLRFLKFISLDEDLPALYPAIDQINLEERHTSLVYAGVNWVALLLSLNPIVQGYKEAYYYLPMFLAEQLSKNGFYREALELYRLCIDYTDVIEDDGTGELKLPLIYPELQQPDEYWNSPQTLSYSYLDDPTNPHTLAKNRTAAYTRYTLYSIINTLLAYADTEYTRDTAESVPRARELYEQALDLMDRYIQPFRKKECADMLSVVEDCMDDALWHPEWLRFKSFVLSLNDRELIAALVDPDAGTYTGDDWPNEMVTNLQTLFCDDSFSWESKFYYAEELIKIKLTEGAAAPSSWLTIGNIFNDNNDTPPGGMTGNIDPTITQGISMLVGGQTGYSGYMQADFDYTLPGQSPTQQQIDETVDGWADQPHYGYQYGDTDYNIFYTGENGVDTGGSGSSHRSTSPGGQSSVNSFGRFGTPGALRGLVKQTRSGNFCTPANPLADIFRMRAEVNLYKIRNCMNISGYKRELDPYAAPTDAFSGAPGFNGAGYLTGPGDFNVEPTLYRYAYLVERAKELIRYAQQLENALLSALEKLDAENYQQFRARQEIETARAAVRLEDLRIKEARLGVDLAEIQLDKAEYTVQGYQEMIDAGLLEAEMELQSLYFRQSSVQRNINNTETFLNIKNTLIEATTSAMNATTVGASIFGPVVTTNPGNYFKAMNLVQNTLIYFDIGRQKDKLYGIQRDISLARLNASQQRREQQWNFQKGQAEYDVQIGKQNIEIAEQRVEITEQQRAIADLRLEQAQDTVEFLQSKFTNAELYEWMSEVLQGFFEYFVQQATGMAQLAEVQLTFERQTPPQNIIQSDYLAPPQDDLVVSGSGDDQQVDRRGLTGSARLLRDLTELEQYSFETRQRKQHVTRTFSLAGEFPGDFIRFKQDGTIRFSLSNEMLDRDHPGHYLRLIRQVRVSVIALTPPVGGIKASLTHLGYSEVVVKGNSFKRRSIKRSAERITLSSPIEDNGMHELRPEANQILFPFEGNGFDGTWEFEMLRASNPFDFQTIADVLITVDYTSMHDQMYKNKVAGLLDSEMTDARVYSFKSIFPDQWYDLHNPAQTATPYKVNFELFREDFPVNMSDVKITGLRVLVIGDPTKMDLQTDLEGHDIKIYEAGNEDDATYLVGITDQDGQAKTNDLSKNVNYGTDLDWTLNLRTQSPTGNGGGNSNGNGSTDPTSTLKDYLLEDKLEDLVLIVEYKGTLPSYASNNGDNGNG